MTSDEQISEIARATIARTIHMVAATFEPDEIRENYFPGYVIAKILHDTATKVEEGYYG